MPRNIRKDTGCDGRQSTENIQITGKTDGKSGIEIRIKDGIKGEQCHIPVIITKPGIQELVYNDFYIGENCDVDIVAGCGIHNCGGESRRSLTPGTAGRRCAVESWWCLCPWCSFPGAAA